MSEKLNPNTVLANNQELQEKTQTPAEQLGLIDGNFLVPRSDGSMESGWEVSSFREVVNPRTGEVETAVFVKQQTPNDDNKVGEKSVRLSEIQMEETKSKTELLAGFAISATMDQMEDKDYSDRHKKLFAPYNLESDYEQPEEDYDYLFKDEKDYQAVVKEKDGLNRQRAVERGTSTDESEKYTLDVILSRFGKDGDLAKSEIAKIITKYLKPESDIASEDSMKLIRNNPNLRYELGDLFLKRQELYQDLLPDRVRRNTQKVPEYPGYKIEFRDLRSQEYVAQLCLARLDGTFDIESAMSEPTAITEDGKVVNGQHRYASDIVLFF